MTKGALQADWDTTTNNEFYSYMALIRTTHGLAPVDFLPAFFTTTLRMQPVHIVGGGLADAKPPGSLPAVACPSFCTRCARCA